MLCLLCCLTIGAAKQPDYELPAELNDALSAFDRAVENKETFERQKFIQIDSLKDVLHHTADSAERLNIIENIGRQYRGIQIDSALTYFTMGRNIAEELNLPVMQARFEALRCTQLPLLGEGLEAVEGFSKLDPDIFETNEDKIIYYQSGANICFSLAGYYPDSEQKQKHIERGVAYAMRLIPYLPTNSVLTSIVLAHLYYTQGKNAITEAMLTEIIDTTSPSNPYFGFAARLLGMQYGNKGNHTNEIYYLALAATHELESGQLEGISLYQLGEALLKRGDTARGHLCLSLATENSMRSGSRIRTMKSGEFVPTLNNIYEHRIQVLTWQIAFLSLLIAIAIFAIVTMWRRMRIERHNLKKMKETVLDASYMKETYISQFLNLCSIYVEKLEEFNKMAKRKITAGQTDELYAILKSGKILDEQSRVFYEIFDKAFLNVYPTFVHDVNSLLQKDKQIVTPAPDTLTTELRIFAFTRLGIDDSTQIARFLNLSLNTIYTYRNKMRSRAIDRDNFEEAVMSIGQIHL